MEKVQTRPGLRVEMVPVQGVQTHPALQPRDPRLLKQRERIRQEQQSEMHVHHMTQFLKADSRAELTPLSLARVGGTLLVVDGHHRLAAYRRARREAVPAYVAEMTLERASHESKLANINHTKLEMAPMHRRNALWHHLAAVTQEGSLGLPQGVSQRSLQGRFGVALDTVQRMLRRLPEVVPEGFPEEHRDGITGWPHWRYVCATARNGMYQQMDHDTRLRWQAEKYLAKLARLWESTDAQALRLAHEELLRDARDDDDRALRTDLVAGYEISQDDGSLDL